MDRYGEAIECDLHREYQLDLLDFFRGRYSWRKLHLLIERLPRASAFMQARLDDPEVAEWVLNQPDSGPGRPAVEEFTAEVAALYDICDRLGEVIVAVMLAGNHTPPTVKPRLRPVTEVERARARGEIHQHLSLVDEVKAAQERWAAANGVSPI